MDKDRNNLPDIAFIPPTEKMSITGVLNAFPQVGLLLEGADEPGSGWPTVVQIINKQKMTEKLQQPIIDFQLQLALKQNSLPCHCKSDCPVKSDAGHHNVLLL
jgi:surfeit locus 1 family protein